VFFRLAAPLLRNRLQIPSLAARSSLFARPHEQAGPRCPVNHHPAGTPALQPPPQIDIAAARRGLAGLDVTVQRCSGDFYGYLFNACPHVRGMFPPLMAEQNERLFGALVQIAGLLDKPDQLHQYLTQLGADHRKYGVEPEHYAAVGKALISALRRHSTTWDEAAEEAWQAAYTVAADTMIAGAASQDGPAYWTGRVLRIEHRTRDLAVLYVQPSSPLPFEGGQHITIQHQKWPRVWRPFSVASTPGEDVLELHVRQVPGGWVSTALVRDTPENAELILGPAIGSMVSGAAGGRDLVCVAGGTGLAPIKSVVTEILAADEQALVTGTGGRRNITVFHGVNTPRELYDMPALDSMSRMFPWLQVIPVVAGDGKFRGLRGNVPDVAAEYGEWMGRDAYIAGPSRMTAQALTAMRYAGIPEDRLHFDDVEVLQHR
jgi:NAD(P)H-flavin reductase/hemoglobin-like flavoprotein